jgi:hypothetical protein
LVGASANVWRVTGAPASLTPVEVVTGPDPMGHGLQVAVAAWASKAVPGRELLRSLHADRVGKRAVSLIVAVWDEQRAWLFGPSPENAPVELPAGQARRILQTVLDEPDGLAARTRYAQAVAAIGTSQAAGVANQGLFATHYLATTAPKHPGWSAAKEQAQPLLGLRHEALIKALGYTTQRSAAHALLLKSGDAARAVAVLLESSEQFDAAASRFDVSPVAWGLRVAARAEVPWLLMLRGSQLRLYPARPGVGVGQKSQANTWFEIDLALVDTGRAALLPLVFSAAALAPGGSTQQFLDGSAQFAVELGQRLRDRVYEHAVPALAQAVAAKLPTLGRAVDAAGLDLAYRLSLRILFRLLFQAYAEDRGLLPYRRNARYDRNALNTWAADLTEHPDQPFDSDSTAIWDDLAQVWRVIDSGDSAWNVPAYNGGLFGCDSELHPEGALLERLRLGNDTMGPVLAALLVDHTDEGGPGAVDFRSLSVREFGTIYEGLLESGLSITPVPLAAGAVKDKGKTREVYLPAQPGDEVLVPAGGVYFHSKSGERKATGTYFTPHIVVEHLLERALEPVLADHLTRVQALLDAGNEASAAEAFFDLRVADLAMGSAHFLTAAIDRIEARMRDFLTEHPIPAITNELRALERAATTALGDDAAAAAQIEPTALLRRQIARRCIYGLDINPMAVELARLAIWITTFVPGLPMSSLDHTLVCGNSLTGVGTLDEALQVLDPTPGSEQISTLSAAITDELVHAKSLLVDVANTSEATKADVTANAHAAARARAESERAQLLFDAVVAARLGLLTPDHHADADSLISKASQPEIADAVAAVNPAHFPYLFPEVFLRENPGFDCLVGNPPWEEVMVEETKFWLRVSPGLYGLPPADQKKEVSRLRVERADLLPELQAATEQAAEVRRLLLGGPFPGLGTGDVDLYRVFAWRNWQLLRAQGSLGIVVPRSLLNAAGNAEWRDQVMRAGGLHIVTLVNSGRWVFPAVHPQYSIALVTIRRTGNGSADLMISGPFAAAERFLAAKDDIGRLQYAALAAADPGLSIPQLPDAESARIFGQIRRAPRLDRRAPEWDFRPVAEFHATNDRATFDTNPVGVGWPVYGGSAFNLWEPDTGEYYAWADPGLVSEALHQKRQRQAGNRRTAFFGLADDVVQEIGTLPCMGSRIAFRDVTRATDSRTVIAALVPPGRVLTNKAPYLYRRPGISARAEAFLLGVMCSLPLDWYARRYVELGLSITFLNSLPIPEPSPSRVLAEAVVEAAGRLAAVDERYADWAAEVGVPVGSVQSRAEREDLIAELDALVSLLYGLSREQVEHVFATFHVGWDYESRLRAVLAHYRRWEARL